LVQGSSKLALGSRFQLDRSLLIGVYPLIFVSNSRKESMSHTLILLLSVFYFFALAAEEGSIGSVQNGTLTFFTPTKTYSVPLGKLTPVEKAKVSDYLATVTLRQGRINYDERQRFDLKVSEHFVVTEENPRGFRPDCNEVPTTAEDLMKVANEVTQGGMVDFLESLPSGSMQVYTLIKETKSKQHHGVGPLNPRIIRSNADGSITMSYVCDPSSQDYGKVEMMHFDQEEERFKFATLNFKSGQDETITTDQEARYSHLSNDPQSHLDKRRVNKNPKACLKCHSSNPEALDPDPRPLWEEYQIWDGAYGSQDDLVEDFAGEAKKDYEDIIALKKKMKGNPCFDALPDYELTPPTPKDFGEFDYDRTWLFPYSSSIKSPSYDVRPNLRLTDTLPRFAARRLGRKFFEQPGFEDIKFEAVMGTFNCPQVKDYDKAFEEKGPKSYNRHYKTAGATIGKGYEKGKALYSPENERGDFRDYRELLKLGAAFGFKNSDWTTNYNDESRNAFHSPSSEGAMADGFADLVQGDLMRRMAIEYPELEKYRVSGGNLEGMFGANNFCVEETTAPIRSHEKEDKERISALCENLDSLRKNRKKSFSHGDSINPNSDPEAILACLEKQNASLSLTFESDFIKSIEGAVLDQEKYEQGEAVAGTCIHCHSNNSKILTDAFSFFENEESLREEMRKGPELMNLTREYIDSGRMPKGIPLDDQQKEDFIYYMEIQYLKALQE